MSVIIQIHLLLHFSLTVKAATLIFIFGRGSAIPSAKEKKSGFIYIFEASQTNSVDPDQTAPVGAV